MQNGDRINIHERLAKLETLVNTMMTNHLPHLDADVKSVKTRLNWLIGIVITSLISVIFLLLGH